jgi:DNA-binding transcriptional regulator YiaG/predicted RNase H-like HicB family nuclease
MKEAVTIPDHYTCRVWWSDPDALFMADVVELQGVLAFGATPEEASRNARDVTGSWLDDTAATGERAPAPRGHAAWVARELASLTVEPVTSDDVRLIRRNLGLTQGTFADLLGVALNTVQAWQQGVNAPSSTAQHLIRLIDAIGRHLERQRASPSGGSVTA